MAITKMAATLTLTLTVRIIHGLISDYGHVTVLQSSGLANELRERGARVDLKSGFFFPADDEFQVDVSIFTHDLLSMRSSFHWPSVRVSVEAWAKKTLISVGMVQDDFTRPDRIEPLVLAGTLEYLMSPHAFEESRVKSLYPRLDAKRVLFSRNGYLDRTATQSFREQIGTTVSDKSSPVFGRIRNLKGAFGALGDHKAKALWELEDELRKRAIPVDFNTSEAARLNGFAWWRRIRESRAVVNPVGGSDLVNFQVSKQPFRRGSYFGSFVGKKKGDRNQIQKHSPAQEVKLPNYGPRVLESLALGTPQVITYLEDLVGVLFPGLAPWEHFIPLDEGLKNVSEVADALGDEKLLEEIAQAGKGYVDDNPNFFYGSLAEQILKIAQLDGLGSPPTEAPFRISEFERPLELIHEGEKFRIQRALMGAINTNHSVRSLDFWSQTITEGELSSREASTASMDLLGHWYSGFLEGRVTPLAIQFLPVLFDANTLAKHDIATIMASDSDARGIRKFR